VSVPDRRRQVPGD